MERLDRDRNADIANDPPSRTDDNAASPRHEETGDSSTQVIYSDDAWSRLVRVEYATRDTAEYEYNGLNWRIIKRADTDLDGTVDQQRIMYIRRKSNLSRLSLLAVLFLGGGCSLSILTPEHWSDPLFAAADQEAIVSSMEFVSGGITPMQTTAVVPASARSSYMGPMLGRQIDRAAMAAHLKPAGGATRERESAVLLRTENGKPVVVFVRYEPNTGKCLVFVTVAGDDHRPGTRFLKELESALRDPFVAEQPALD